MRKIVQLSILISIMLSTDLTGQTTNTDIILGYQRQKCNVIELGVASSVRNEFTSYRNVHLCGEYLSGNAGPSIFGIKGRVDFSYVIFLFSGQAGYYFNDNGNSFLIRPEVGRTLLGFFDFTYGYNLFLENESLDMGKNVVSLRFKLPTSMWY